MSSGNNFDEAKTALASTAPTAAEPANDNRVELDEPIVRGAQTITHIDVRKPMAGELRGIALVDLLNLEVNALRKVLPRITTPTLTDVEVGRMDPADLVDLGAKVAGFLVKKSVKAEASLTA